MGDNIIEEAGATLNKEYGPLPLWGWLAGGLGVAAGFYFFVLRRKVPGTTRLAGNPLPPMMDGGGGGGLSDIVSPIVTPSKPTPEFITNQQWLRKAIDAVVESTGMAAGVVEMYLNEYLGGNSPRGNQSAISNFQRVISTAISRIGNPPQNVPQGDINTNPYQNNSTYLQSVLAFLPQNSGGTIRQEIMNLFNGTQKWLSNEAEAAFAYARSIVGESPNPISYTIGRPVVTTPPAAKAILSLPGQWFDNINEWYKTNVEMVAKGDAATKNRLWNIGTYQAIFSRFTNIPADKADQIAATLWKKAADYAKAHNNNWPGKATQEQWIKDEWDKLNG